MDTEDIDWIKYKIVVVGDSGTGKTNIITRYMYNEFKLDCKSTVAVDFHGKKINYYGKSYKFQLWDTAGQERYRAMTTSHYKGSIAAIVVFDVTHQSSFENTNNWIKEISQLAESCEIIMLVGNKIDLNTKRVVDISSILRLCHKYKALYTEVSAFKNIGISSLFTTLLHHIVLAKAPEAFTRNPGHDEPLMSKFRTSTNTLIDPSKFESPNAAIDADRLSLHWATTEWKEDQNQLYCVICDRHFSWFLRRHHCRKCGYIFCGQHCSNWMTLPEIGYLSPTRVCDLCVKEESTGPSVITRHRTMSSGMSSSSSPQNVRSRQISTSSSISFSRLVGGVLSSPTVVPTPVVYSPPPPTQSNPFFDNVYHYLENLPDFFIIKTNWQIGACSCIHIAKFFARKYLVPNVFDRDTDLVVDMYKLLHPESSVNVLSSIHLDEEDQVANLHNLIEPVVLKVYNPAAFRSTAGLLREIDCLHRCTMPSPNNPTATLHPNIIAIEYISPQFDRYPFLATKYSSFGTLQDVLYDGTEYPILDWPIRLEILLQILSALQYLHGKIEYLHNDLCCANILVITDLSNQRGTYRDLVEAISQKQKFLSSRVKQDGDNTQVGNSNTEFNVPPMIQLFDFHCSRPQDYLETRAYREFQPRPTHCAPEAFWSHQYSTLEEWICANDPKHVAKQSLENMNNDDVWLKRDGSKEAINNNQPPAEDNYRDDKYYYYSTPAEIFSFSILVAEVLGRCCNTEIFQQYPPQMVDLVQQVVFYNLRPKLICYQQSLVGEKKKKKKKESFQENVYQSLFVIDKKFSSSEVLLRLKQLVEKGWQSDESQRPTVKECIQEIEQCLLMLSGDKVLQCMEEDLTKIIAISSSKEIEEVLEIPVTTTKQNVSPRTHKEMRYEIINKGFRMTHEIVNISSQPLNRTLSIRSNKLCDEANVDWHNAVTQLKLDHEWVQITELQSTKLIEVKISPNSKMLVEQEWLEISRKLVLVQSDDLVYEPSPTDATISTLENESSEIEGGSKDKHVKITILREDTLGLIKLEPIRSKEIPLEIATQSN